MKGSAKRYWKGLLAAVLLVTTFVAVASAAPKNIFTRRYVWLNYDYLGRPAWLEDLKPHTKRAADAGYNGIYLRCAFHKIKRPDLVAKLKDYVSYAKGLGLAVTPTTLYQGDVSEQDVNQAEAFPVKGTQFLVAGTSAKVKSDHSVALQNSSFDSYSNNIPTGWNPADLVPGTSLFMDTQIKHSGTASVRVENPSGYLCRLEQRVSGLKPNRAYELSLWVKTQDFTHAGEIGFFVQRGNGQPLLYRRDFGLAPWNPNSNVANFKRYTIDFNTIEATTVKVCVLFAHFRSKGKVWVDDVAIREVGLYETIRRPSCPVVVRAKDGKTTYVEGKDYTVKNSPPAIYNGGGGQEMTIPSGSRIKSGDYLIVDWYQHANVETIRATTNYASLKSWEMQTANIAYTDQLIGNPKGIYVFYDEWRDAGWDPYAKCLGNAGEYMGWTAARTYDQVRAKDCNRDVYVVQDMYDPYHNAVTPYNMTFNGVSNSWKRVPENMIMLNWRPSSGVASGEHNPTYKSLMFLGGLDPKYPSKRFRQVISPNILAPGETQKWEDAIALGEKRGLTGIIGFAYVVWGNWGPLNYDLIESSIQIFKNNGRWATGPIPFGDVKQDCPHSFKPSLPECAGGVPSVKDESPSHPTAQQAKGRSGLHIAGSGRLSFTLSQTSDITIALLNAQGRTVKTIEVEQQAPGSSTVDLRSSGLPAGIYLARMVATAHGSESTFSKKLVLF